MSRVNSFGGEKLGKYYIYIYIKVFESVCMSNAMGMAEKVFESVYMWYCA